MVLLGQELISALLVLALCFFELLRVFILVFLSGARLVALSAGLRRRLLAISGSAAIRQARVLVALHEAHLVLRLVNGKKFRIGLRLGLGPLLVRLRCSLNLLVSFRGVVRRQPLLFLSLLVPLCVLGDDVRGERLVRLKARPRDVLELLVVLDPLILHLPL